MTRNPNLKTSKGNVVTHAGKPWTVDKVLIHGRQNKGEKDYVRAFPMCGNQVLKRSGRNIGEEWEPQAKIMSEK